MNRRSLLAMIGLAPAAACAAPVPAATVPVPRAFGASLLSLRPYASGGYVTGRAGESILPASKVMTVRVDAGEVQRWVDAAVRNMINVHDQRSATFQDGAGI